ncbi:hypothetical protein [Haladaptatus sp. DYSN1]|nr:hypothetical protein [Haladaptatus sp. DYSN1]
MPHTRVRKKYSIGGGVECIHPVENRRYLGHQGEGAYFQCTLCESVVISYGR